ncbi:MAG: hypothetical protein ABID40_06190, partial [Candidatus Bipolaricaulota bacterium]
GSFPDGGRVRMFINLAGVTYGFDKPLATDVTNLIDLGTGQVTGTIPTPGQSTARFVLPDETPLTIELVDGNGDPVAAGWARIDYPAVGEVTLPATLGSFPDGGRLRMFINIGGVTYGLDKSFATNATNLVDLGTTETTGTVSTPGQSTVRFVFADSTPLTIDLVDGNGDPVAADWARIDYPAVGEVTLPATLGSFPDGGRVRMFINIGGVTYGLDKSFATNATNLVDLGTTEITGTIPTPGQSAVRFVFANSTPLTIELVDGNGDPVVAEWARIDYPAVGEVTLPATLGSFPDGGRLRMSVTIGGVTHGFDRQFATHAANLFDLGTQVITGAIPTPGQSTARLYLPGTAPVVASVETVDAAGAPVAGQLFFNLAGLGVPTGQWVDAPQTITPAEGTGIFSEAQFKALKTSAGITVQGGHTYSVDALTKEVTDTATPGTTAIRFVFPAQTVSVAVETVDENGNAAAGELFFNAPGIGVPTGQFLDAPRTIEPLAGAWVHIESQFMALKTAGTIQPQSGRTYSVDARTKEVTDTATPGTTLIRFVYPAQTHTVVVKTVNQLGAAVAGQLFFNAPGMGVPTGQWLDAPRTIQIAAGGAPYIVAQLSGIQAAKAVVVEDGHTYTVDVQTGEVADAATPGTTAIRFAWTVPLLSVPVQTADQDGSPVPAKLFFNTSGLGVPTGEALDAPLTIQIGEGVTAAFAAEFGGLRPYVGVTVSKGHTYTVDARTAEVADSPTPGTTLIRFVFPADYNDVPIETVDGSGAAVPAKLA